MTRQRTDWTRQQLEDYYYQDKLSLSEIGRIYGVSKQRIQIVFKSFNIPRARKRKGREVYTLDTYLSQAEHREHDSQHFMELFIPKIECEECHSRANLNFHHLVYPMQKLSDIQILCASCHVRLHRGKNDRNGTIVELRKLGETFEAIGKSYGLSRQATHYIYHREVIKSKGLLTSQ